MGFLLPLRTSWRLCTTWLDGFGTTSGPLHTWDWEPVTITLWALSLVEKAEPIQVRFTLCLRNQRSMWMQDGWKVYMESYVASNGSCFMVNRIIFKNHLLEVGLTQHRETWHSKCSHMLIYSILSCMRTHMNNDSLQWHLVEGLITYGFTLHLRICDHTTWRCLRKAFGHFHLGSHNFMVTPLGLCVKWPLVFMLLASWKMESSQNNLMWPPNFDGW